MLDVKEIRKDFPILDTNVNGKKLVFLDSAASSQKPIQVIETINKYYREENANIHRGVYQLSQKATERYEISRIKIAEFIGAKCAKVAIFTRNTTEGINLVANTWGKENIGRGDEIVITELEHHSNIVPWHMLAKEKNAKVKFFKVNPDSTLDLSNINDVITIHTKLVAISQMSNATGTIHDLSQITKRAREVGAIILVDGAQGASHLKTNVQKLDFDFYAFSAHKMLGPTGVGILYGKEEILERMSPWMGGGDMISDVTMERTEYADLPARLEAGTPNIADVIAFRTAIEYLEQVGLDNIHEHEQGLVKYALQELSKVEGVILYGTDLENRGGVVSFNIDGVHPHDVGSILDEDGIAIRAGHHCCQPYMKRMNLSGTCRASFYLYNTLEEVDLLVKGVKKVREIFSRVRKK